MVSLVKPSSEGEQLLVSRGEGREVTSPRHSGDPVKGPLAQMALESEEQKSRNMLEEALFTQQSALLHGPLPCTWSGASQ